LARNAYITSNMTDPNKAEMVMRLCQRAIELDPNYARAWAMLAVSQRALVYAGREGDDGIVAAERALELDPTVVEAHGARIGVLIGTHEYDKAKAEVDAALKLDPDSYEVHKEAARLALRLHRYDDAILHYEKCASEMEIDFSATGMLMTCYQAAGNAAGLKSAAERTLARTEKLLAQDPNNGSALSMGIGALAYLGQRDRAKEWTARAIIVDPENSNMRYNIACAFILDLKDNETALDILEPAIAKFGKDRLAHAKTDPDLDPVRAHPRFKAMIAAAEARLG
jgi:adenylate cyclase